MLRKLEKTRDVPLQLKEAADATAYVLKMRVMEPVNDVNTEAVTAFIQFLRASNAVQDETWYNGEYLGRRITVTLMKQALQHLRVPLGGKTNKGDLGHLLTQNLYNTEPLDSEGDTDMALSVLNKWFMAPIKGEATKGLREGLANEAEVLRLGCEKQFTL
jgi:hypothetical protein